MSFDPSRLARIDTHFQKYVDDGRLTGFQVHVAQHGSVVHEGVYGLADREAGVPVATDTLWRIYSMTKPITSVAAMTLWEEGEFELTDPVSKWIPSFADCRVFSGGTVASHYTVPAIEPVRMWHLLAHTSGLTYGFLELGPVDGLYRQAGFALGQPDDRSLQQMCDAWAGLPLKFQPGSQWGYGVSTDVLGRVLEVIAGKTLAEVIGERVLQPLGMTDTCWSSASPRLAALYAAIDGKAVRYDLLGDLARAVPRAYSGGGGLISTAADYAKFTAMLVGGGAPLLAPRTLEMMTANHLPGVDLAACNSGGFAETVFEGVGFGLGFAVIGDPVPGRSASSVGEFYWGGLASTAFWVDRQTGVTASFYTQLVPSSTHPIRPQLRQLVYAALR